MILHAGSLYRNYLILYGGELLCWLQIDNEVLRWDIYCNDIEVKIMNEKIMFVFWKDRVYKLPYVFTNDSLKATGFIK